MVKRFSSIILALAILVAGYFAQRKLNFRERSIMVFKLNTSEQQFGRGIGRNPGSFESRKGFRGGQERGLGERNELPDSLRMRFEQRNEAPSMIGRNIPDSLFTRGNEGDIPGQRMRQRGGFDTGKKINLQRVILYLAIFAAFTVIAIYIDNIIRLVNKRPNNRPGMVRDEVSHPENGDLKN